MGHVQRKFFLRGEKMLKFDRSAMLLAIAYSAAILSVNPVSAADEPVDPPVVQEQPAPSEGPKTAPVPAAETVPPPATMQNLPSTPAPAEAPSPQAASPSVLPSAVQAQLP